MNSIIVSPDRRELTILGPDGREAYIRSRLPNGFTDAQLDYARQYRFSVRLPGQRDWVWRIPIAGHAVLVNISTGPPTWWWPHAEITRRSVMLGWLRGMIALIME